MPDHDAAPALDVAGVSHSYGTRVALDDVSLRVPRGRFVALLGVNGAGKSTLFNLVTRLFVTRVGEISICGHPVERDARAALARTGVVFQSRALDASLTVAQNFRYQGALHGRAWGAVRPRMEALLDKIGMGDRAGDKVGRLSGGQVRRVEIARALLHSPALLLCDEATVGLDVKSRADIVADVHRLTAQEGVGVLWTTHLIDEIWPQDPVVVLHRGRVLARGPAAEIAGAQGLSEAFLEMTAERGGDAA
ncbi:ABC transporter ATP-binding protein [Marinibacterium profundimaris]|uniref:ABC transporter ATP-binding protein n=1 Tax=Marinibacterium profundimaris TaxID=1679460 RepID=A0A225NQF3_9RHOB|nr:ABC transporter ATP-binding protein [Marinibacterium profundimaris]OWU74742.1 ABC transporter ATP-binding protein [Marinibacterium profundimaris]